MASSGTPEKIRAWPRPAPGLYDTLAPHIFSATQVERGKPAPDLFLFAAEQMRRIAAACVVIEDSVPGVTGARAAGMTVLGFHGGSHCRPGYAEKLRAAGAAMTFDDMRQLPGLIAGKVDRRLKAPRSAMSGDPKLDSGSMLQRPDDASWISAALAYN